ncbi:MAG: hypothetical protein AAF569_03220 [Pseudomonadota bacterium]
MGPSLSSIKPGLPPEAQAFCDQVIRSIIESSQGNMHFSSATLFDHLFLNEALKDATVQRFIKSMGVDLKRVQKLFAIQCRQGFSDNTLTRKPNLYDLGRKALSHATSQIFSDIEFEGKFDRLEFFRELFQKAMLLNIRKKLDTEGLTAEKVKTHPHPDSLTSDLPNDGTTLSAEAKTLLEILSAKQGLATVFELAQHDPELMEKAASEIARAITEARANTTVVKGPWDRRDNNGS